MDKENVAPSENFLSGFGTAVGGTPAYRRYTRGAQNCYKPITTKSPFLAGILILTLALIAIVEVVLHQYPVDNDRDSLAGPGIPRRSVYDDGEDGTVKVNGAYQRGNIGARALSASTFESFVPSPPISGIGASIQMAAFSATTTLVETSTTDTSAYIPTIYASTDALAYLPTSTNPRGAFIPIETSNSQSSFSPSGHYYTPSSAYVPETPVYGRPITRTFLSFESPPPRTDHRTDTSEYIPTTEPPRVLTTITLPSHPPASTTFTTTPGEYLPTEITPGGMSSVSSTQNGGGTVSTAPGAITSGDSANSGALPITGVPTSTVNDQNTLATSLVPVATHTSDGMAVVVLGSPSKIPLVPVSTYTSNGVALVVMGSLSKSPLVPVSTYTSNGAAYVVMGSSTEAPLVPVSTMTSNGVALVVLGRPTSQPTAPAVLPSSYSVVVEQITSTSGSVAYVYMTTLTLGPSQLASYTATAVAPQSTVAATSNQQTKTIVFTDMSYFAAWYLPTIIAVAFRVLWTVVYNNARLMEPFYRLASPAGVAGRDVLDNLYLSMGSIVPEPVLALLSGHSYMLLVSTISYLIELIAPLSSEFLRVDVHHGCIPDPHADINHPCPKRVVVRLVPARALQAVLCLIAIFIIFIIFLSRNRHSGVYSDPSSIAAMGSLLHHPDVLQDFKYLDASNKELERAVKDQTYRLTHYQAEGEGMKYGIVPTIKVVMSDVGNTGSYKVLANPEGGVDIRSPSQGLFSRHLFRTIGDILLAFLMLGIFGITLGYYLDAGGDGFNAFFNSDTFGPKFLLAFAGGLAVSQWKRVEKEVRTLQPYRHLSSSSSSSPLDTILWTSTSTPYTTFPLAIARFELFTALIAFCYILSEILVITIVTVPYSSNEYWTAFLAGTYVSLSILSLQILIFTAMVTWWRWTTPHLDRDPDTLMGVWTLLAASDIRADFDDMGTAGREDLVRTVLAWDKRYWLGDVVRKDGVMRTGIHSDEAHEDARFERLRGERPPSPLPFSLPTLPTVPKITISSDIY